MGGKTKTLISERRINKRTKELAKEMTEYYKNRDVVFICVLKGSFMFFSSLVKELDIRVSIDFIGVASYEGTKSTNKMKTYIFPDKKIIAGKSVVLVDDIYDTGQTLDYIIKKLKDNKVKSVDVCVLLIKQHKPRREIPISYCGFLIPDKFVIGYGLDYNEDYRNLRCIKVLDE